MTRISVAPNKSLINVPDIPRVTLGVITHYTFEPYHKYRMRVVKLCLDSMLRGFPGDVSRELVIWDNGSTPEFIGMLETYNPDVLIKSINIGIDNAKAGIGAIARGGILCLSDDDILFHPDWFKLQEQVLTTYPNVGIVSGSPQKGGFLWSTETLKWGHDNAQVMLGAFPSKWETDFCLSVGYDPIKYAEEKSAINAYAFVYRGVPAWGHGHHFQYMGYASVLRPFLEKKRSSFLMARGQSFNEILDRSGYLGLTTFDRTALHIGNLVDESILEIMLEWGMSIEDFMPDLER